MGEQQSVTGAPRTWRVLVVDDEENLNWSLVASLRRENYAADGALTAEDARRRLTEMPYDCVISDVKMPGMDGFQLLSWLREWRPSTRVIMMTAFGSPTLRQEAYRSGVVAYLEKPFDLRALKHELRRTLEEASQQPTTYDLIDITQVINIARRDIAMQITAGGQPGMLFFSQGDLIAAEYGGLYGDDAFMAMCAVPAQSVQQVALGEQPERNVTKPVSALIFDALLARNARPSAGPASVAPARTTPPSLTPPTFTASAAASSGILFPAPGQMAAPSQQAQDAQRTLAALVATIALPCVAALIATDGAVKAIAQTRRPPATDATFTQLAQGLQLAARAMAGAQWGSLREARLMTADHSVLARLLSQGPGALALVVAVPVAMDPRQLDAAIAAHESALRLSAI